VITQLHSEAPRRLNSTVRNETDQHVLLNAVLLKLQVEISVCKAALRPVFLDDDIALLGTELGVEFATPTTRLKGKVGPAT
jgi:hypothetical protein